MTQYPNTQLSTALMESLRRHSIPKVLDVRTLSGGCCAQVFRLDTQDGPLVLKWQPDAISGLFEAEAMGLHSLAACSALAIPDVIAYSGTWLCIRYLATKPAEDRYWCQFGEALAQLHRPQPTSFGFTADNFCGTTPQPNPVEADGHHFFAEHRLMFQAKRAQRRRLLCERRLEQIQRLCERLPEFIPQQRPALIHGDLWHGNAMSTTLGPALIDPACYWGWAEAELAMTTLFGAFPKPFYDAYAANAELDWGWRERAPLYNLYHLLNHLNLFGSSYYAEIVRIIDRYLK